ncbi:hypothetical protein BM1_06737 [Bipolaris maydis]|nr:hypothetical protein BM1_06737 [Bipolaris maydis]
MLNVERGVKVAFTNGNTKEFRFLVHNPLTYSGGLFATQLGLALSEIGDVKADAPAFQTSERGVFTAGDYISPYKGIPHTIITGNFPAIAAATQLQAEKHRHFSMGTLPQEQQLDKKCDLRKQEGIILYAEFSPFDSENLSLHVLSDQILNEMN